MSGSNNNDNKEGWTNGTLVNDTNTNTTEVNYHGSFSRGGAFKNKGFVDPSFYSSSVLIPISKNSQFEMKITSTETVYQKHKSYTVYVIKVKSDQHQWEIVRRYKHFRVFSIQIQNEVSSLSNTPSSNTSSSFEFPSKKLIGNMNPNFIKNRKDQLQKFLESITQSKSAKLSRNLKVFLDPNFSPSLKTIVNPSKEGYLYLLKPGKYTLSKKQWTKVYCIATNSNLFYWKNRDQPYAEARGVIQLYHCTTKKIEKQDRICIEINENNNGNNNNNNNNNINDNSKYLFLSKGKSFSHRIHHSDIPNNINNNNNNNNVNNKETTTTTTNSNNNNNSDIYYVSSESDSILQEWIDTIEKETFKYLKEQQILESFNSNMTNSNNVATSLNGSGGNGSNSPPTQRLKLGSIIGGSKLNNRKSVKKLYKDDDVVEEVEVDDNSVENKMDKEYKLLESVLSNATCKDLLVATTPSSSTCSTPSSSFLNLNSSSNSSKPTTTTTTNTTTTSNTNSLSNIELLHSEEITYFAERIIHMHQNTGTIGSITITNYRFYFSSTVGCKSISIPLAMISKILKCVGFTLDKVKYYAFEMICKDFNRARFMCLPGSSQSKANSRLFEILESLIFKPKYQQLFCFLNEEILGGDGWHMYNPLKEFERQGILSDENWRISHYNQDYLNSPTYPSVIFVPKKITDQELISTCSFRSKGRIPALVWKSPTSNSVIVRCSQPVVGISKKRSLDDEKLIETIRLANPQSDSIYIMDARPQLNAVVNQMMGLGYEDTNNHSYNNCILKFLNIENIHKMRHCQKKLFKAIMSDNVIDSGGSGSGSGTSNVINNEANANSNSSGGHSSSNNNNNNLINLEEATCNWLEHIRAILYGALDIVDTIQFFNSSVVVHCSDGWDRTSQLCALSELLLDSYYRTIVGFQVLIEKEWLSFGHKFESRIGHGSKNHKSEEYSPVFLQFIDCVYQIMQQNPTSFEFNTKYLLDIIHHLYSCRFGTFLFDCQQKRMDANLITKTTSIWSWINQQNSTTPSIYQNINYIFNSDEPPIRIDKNSDLLLWSEYYLHWRNYYLSN